MASTSAADREPPESNADNASAFFECNVCLDVARDPVVSMVILRFFNKFRWIELFIKGVGAF